MVKRISLYVGNILGTLNHQPFESDVLLETKWLLNHCSNWRMMTLINFGNLKYVSSTFVTKEMMNLILCVCLYVQAQSVLEMLMVS